MLKSAKVIKLLMGNSELHADKNKSKNETDESFF